jgi:hypothetical protein
MPENTDHALNHEVVHYIHNIVRSNKTHTYFSAFIEEAVAYICGDESYDFLTMENIYSQAALNTAPKI